jgi:hypothetical protein
MGGLEAVWLRCAAAGGPAIRPMERQVSNCTRLWASAGGNTRRSSWQRGAGQRATRREGEGIVSGSEGLVRRRAIYCGSALQAGIAAHRLSASQRGCEPVSVEATGHGARLCAPSHMGCSVLARRRGLRRFGQPLATGRKITEPIPSRREIFASPTPRIAKRNSTALLLRLGPMLVVVVILSAVTACVVREASTGDEAQRALPTAVHRPPPGPRLVPSAALPPSDVNSRWPAVPD